jgi:hypothetical protein
MAISIPVAAVGGLAARVARSAAPRAARAAARGFAWLAPWGVLDKTAEGHKDPDQQRGDQQGDGNHARRGQQRMDVAPFFPG